MQFPKIGLLDFRKLHGRKYSIGWKNPAKYLHYSFILFFFVSINSICEDCLNYKEELRDWALWNSDNLRNFPKGAKTRPDNRSYNLKQK